MTRVRVRAALCALCVVTGVGLATLARVGAQVPGSLPSPTIQQADLMAALLAEVKAMRAELRQAAQISTRSQFVLGRVQLQELHLGRLDQQLALVSSRRLDASRDRAATTAQLRDLERRRRGDASADERNAVDAEVRRVRTQLQEQQSLEEQYRRQEGDLTNALATEEERLHALSAQLDALDAVPRERP